ncbi:MAG: BREX-1 system adenine-specific DNA-methyltransferase PglX [Paludibacter sp.]|nr:BREX-1 system adenine-specific DNA-methyltransferase PglX [Paludibacter sp.]
MDKNAIKKYAIWAREELIKRVSTKAEEYEIRANAELVDNIETIGDRVLTATEKKQRTALINIVKDKGFAHAMEEAAYTWFNRFIALRFMEVNGYLPSKVRVFTDDENNFKPQILDEAIHMELEGLNLEKVLDLKEQNKTDELYKYLIITQCNALHSVLPKMFPKIDDYTELLFPDNILREGSAIEQMIAIIPEEDFKDAVQILGWLYQFYNTEPKSIVDKQKAKISKEQIPAATQLFTPDWIVRYMVENSLGRLWIERNPNEELKSNWKYYLDEAQQTEEVQSKLDEIRKKPINLEEIKIIDPCMGSGHILVYAFDILVQIYESQGYSSRDAVASILKNNLYGLDLDERAYQLSYFALMMKARSYDRRFLTRKIEPQVYCPIGYAEGEEYGSLVEVNELEEQPKLPEVLTLFDLDYDIKLNTWNFRRLLNQKYDVVVTNPPYKGSGDLNATLGGFVKKKYPDSKSDLFAVFIERCLQLSNKDAYVAMVTMHSWMFLSSYEKLRAKLLHTDIINMAHLGARAFEEIGGEVVQTTSWVMKKSDTKGYKGTYKRLVDFNSQDSKEKAFLAEGNLYQSTEQNFVNIPGNPIAYWVSEAAAYWFTNSENIGSLGEVVSGMTTGNNEEYLRKWYELYHTSIAFNNKDISEVDLMITKWIPYNKGGEQRKWYGNNEYVVNWSKSTSFNRAKTTMTHLYLKPCITWSDISGTTFAGRYCAGGFMFDVKGSCGFSDEVDNLYKMISVMNSKVTPLYIEALNPTTTTQVGDLKRIPLCSELNTHIGEIIPLSKESIAHSKIDWDSFETSWDFIRHPIVPSSVAKLEQVNSQFAVSHIEKFGDIAWHFENWKNECSNRFEQLKANEKELNRIFIDIYGLQDELTPEVEDKDIKLWIADRHTDIKSFISYAVGCMFGRYSLDVDGLAFAGGEFDSFKYTSFIPDKDNVIPICDDEYFEDDIVGRFIEFVKVVYGVDTLEQNLDFIASALGGKGTSRDVIRAYFLNSFYADHCKIYQKRPIYWQIDSGKKNGFKALIYMHRYEQDTMARVRTDYVHEQQGRYRTAIADLERRIADASTSERVKLNKQLTALKDQETEIRIFEEKIHHLADQMIRIDLDDGVKNNHAIFGDVLTKIK